MPLENRDKRRLMAKCIGRNHFCNLQSEILTPLSLMTLELGVSVGGFRWQKISWHKGSAAT